MDGSPQCSGIMALMKWMDFSRQLDPCKNSGREKPRLKNEQKIGPFCREVYFQTKQYLKELEHELNGMKELKLYHNRVN